MGQKVCSSDTLRPPTLNISEMFDDSEITIQQEGDNPARSKLDNKFLRTEVVASWNILQQKTMNYQNYGHIFSNKVQIYDELNAKIKTHTKSLQGRIISNSVLQSQNAPFTKMKYRAELVPHYQNIQIDISSFIKIKTDNVNDYYQFQDKIGEGTFGNVYRGIQKRTGQVRAIKALKKKSMNNTSKVSLIAEIDLLKTLDHPNIIKLYDLFLYEGAYYVITQFCEGGSLQEFFNFRRQELTQKTIKVIMKQLLSVLNYMNNQNVVHRDLKLQNIVFLKKQQQQSDKNCYQIKIIDFGTAIRVQKHKKNTSALIGTIFYIAPEFTKGFFTQKCDIWSAGVILFILLFHDYPFKGKKQRTILDAISNQALELQKLKKSCSKQALQVLQTMLDKNYLSRSSAKTLLQYQFFRDAKMGRASHDLSESAALKFTSYNRKNNFISIIESFLTFKKITQKERQQLSKIFFQIDKDNSGLIQSGEMLEFLKKQFPEYRQENIKQIIQNVDKNNSGKIDFNQFITVMAIKTELFASQALREAFDHIDRDKTGFITKKQIKQLLKNAQKTQIQEVFEHLDENGDQKITFQEFQSYLKSC